MTLPAEVIDQIEEEEKVLQEVVDSLKSQQISMSQRYHSESQRARNLTEKIVAATRNEDKEMLASDEAVSHSLRNYRQGELQSIDKLRERPYFARFVVEEEINGKNRLIEYKLGSNSNTDCRIIDWRKAPIARLYYEYREGDEYFEEIQDRERSGVIRLRNQLEIDSEDLLQISCRYGTYRRHNGTWQEQSTLRGDPSLRNYGQLPNILSLITPEQFQAITEDAETAVLIQGVAGSGKTTVALHRLSWLLHEDNSDIQKNETVVVVLHPALKSYIVRSLPELSLEGVSVLTYEEWAEKVLKNAYRGNCSVEFEFTRPPERRNPAVVRVKRSLALLRTIEEHVRSERFAAERPKDSLYLQQDLLAILSNPSGIMEHDRSGLLDRETIELARKETETNFSNKRLDVADDALLVYIAQLRAKHHPEQYTPPSYRHIVVDEVQDFGATELATMISAAGNTKQVTLAGDTGQEISKHGSFPGWEKLRRHWSLDPEVSKFVELNVSHRSTLPIMRLADHVGGKQRTTDGRAGKVPLWLHCRSENEGVREAINWLNRVVDRFPTSLTAVLCRNRNEARHVHSLLEPSFPMALRLAEDENYEVDEGIVVTSVEEVKGLEFPHVLVWNPNQRAYPKKKRSRNLLYVGLTRAEELLCLVTWGRSSPLLPHIHSQLVRGYDRTEEEQ